MQSKSSRSKYLLKILLLVAVLCIGCCNMTAQPQDPLQPVDPNRGYPPARGMKHSNPTTVSVGSVLDSNEAKETFLKVSIVSIGCTSNAHLIPVVR